MSTAPTEFEQLMERVRAGCPEAAREVFDRYSSHVQCVVRRWLSHRLRQQYDSADFLQSVWASFFQVPPDRYTFATPEDLVRFLSRVACNKVTTTFRRRLVSGRYNISHEVPLEDGSGELLYDRPGPEPTPSQLAIAAERWEALLRGQPPQLRRALEMLRTGHSYLEVAQELGVHPKVIQRLLRKLQERGELP